MNTKFIRSSGSLFLFVLITGCSEGQGVTRANYEMVKGGMTVQEVHDILGEPAEMSAVVSRGPTSTWQKIIWRNESTGDFVDIQFIDGRVMLPFYGNENEVYEGDREGLGRL